jgi:hypothetical protein
MGSQRVTGVTSTSIHGAGHRLARWPGSSESAGLRASSRMRCPTSRSARAFAPVQARSSSRWTFVAFVYRTRHARAVAHRTGRPARSTTTSQQVVGIRFTDVELALLKSQAGYEPVSSWVRRMVLEVAREGRGAGTAADRARAGRAAPDRAVKRVPARKAADARRDRRAPARPGAGHRSIRRGKAQGA